MIPRPRYGLVALVLLGLAQSAAAQWTRVSELPATDIFSVRVNGDTITAGADTVVYVSTDAGGTWRRSSKPTAGVTSVQATQVRSGRLYAGTYGQGVFVSDDLGDTWLGFNEGLVGGLFDSQLFLADLQVRGDSLYAATLGAGVYVRELASTGTWSHFGEAFEPNQASNVSDLALGGTRLLASAGGNGTVFFRDPGDGEWTLSWLDNVGLHPGLQSQAAAWTGSGWVVGSNAGVFRSPAGESPWTRVDLGLGSLLGSSFATRGRHLFAAFDVPNAAVIGHSGDDGATWQVLESLQGVFVYQLAASGTDLYAGRADGLWRRPTASVSVPRGSDRPALELAILGSQPVGDEVRFRFVLPGPGRVSIDVFDVAGRRVAGVVRASYPAGPHEASWHAGRLGPGVYRARLASGGWQAVVPLVRIR